MRDVIDLQQVDSTAGAFVGDPDMIRTKEIIDRAYRRWLHRRNLTAEEARVRFDFGGHARRAGRPRKAHHV